jgi:hypothetical protein
MERNKMAKVKLLRNPGRIAPGLSEGQEADVDEKMADELVRRNLATRIDKTIKAVPDAPLKGVPDEPEAGSVEKSETDLRDYSQRARRAKTDGN